ncbi:hypothetical protein P8452_31481 [Trifolium repens]|nr:hypothetical protein P8452_31481 [Trifolium repens]
MIINKYKHYRVKEKKGVSVNSCHLAASITQLPTELTSLTFGQHISLSISLQDNAEYKWCWYNNRSDHSFYESYRSSDI